MRTVTQPWEYGDARSHAPPLIALDPQHINKTAQPFDRGAAFDIDGDGVVRRDEHEVDLVLEYVADARKRLEFNRIPVVDGFSGYYPARNQHADELGAALYMACHMNAGRGRYGLIGIDYRSPVGSTSRRAAAELKVAWEELLDIEVQLLELTPHGSRAQRNGYATIWRRRGAALLLEPLFLDGHAELLKPAIRPHTISLIGQGIDLAVRRSMTIGAL